MKKRKSLPQGDLVSRIVLTLKAPTTIAEFANTVEPDEIWIYSVCPLVYEFSS